MGGRGARQTRHRLQKEALLSLGIAHAMLCLGSYPKSVSASVARTDAEAMNVQSATNEYNNPAQCLPVSVFNESKNIVLDEHIFNSIKLYGKT